MRLLRTTAIVVTAVLIVLLVVVVPPVYSAPSADGTLVNPGFEGGWTKSSVEPDWNGIPDGWQPWYIDGGTLKCPDAPSTTYQKPAVEQEQHGTHVHGGSSSARVYARFAVANAGLVQKVTVTPGTTYQFSAWGFLWASDSGIVDTPSVDPIITFQVGIDPGGGTNGAGVTWSPGTTTMDTFTQQSVSAVATGTTLSVYLRATSQWCIRRNDAFFDDASLVATATGPAPTAAGGGGNNPKPTAAPSGGTWGAKAGTIVTATPGPDGSIVHTVGSGQTCIGIATAYGIELATLEKQNNLTNASCKFISVGVQLIIKPAGSGGGGGDPGGGEASGEATEAPAAAEPTIAPTEAPPALGTVCVLGYADANGNGIREPGELKQEGMTFTVNSPTGPVANYTTDGASEPHCFAQLQPGDYTITWEGEGLQSTNNEQSWPVSVAGGSTASHEFGVSGEGAAPPQDPTNPTDGALPSWAIALIGAFGVILFMGGLGVAGYFLLLRRSNI